MSPERIEISKIGKTCDRQRFLPRSAKKSDKLWSTNNKVGHVSLDPRKSALSEDHISVPRGCCPLKFLQALENDQGLLAHTPPGTGVPQPFLTMNFQKLP